MQRCGEGGRASRTTRWFISFVAWSVSIGAMAVLVPAMLAPAETDDVPLVGGPPAAMAAPEPGSWPVYAMPVTYPSGDSFRTMYTRSFGVAADGRGVTYFNDIAGTWQRDTAGRLTRIRTVSTPRYLNAGLSIAGNNLYVADGNVMRADVVSGQTATIVSFPTTAPAIDVAVEPSSGDLIVASVDHSTPTDVPGLSILRYTSAGTYVGQLLSTSGSPVRMQVVGGQLYLLTSASSWSRLRVLDLGTRAESQLTASTGAGYPDCQPTPAYRGPASGLQICGATGLTVDRNRNIFITDRAGLWHISPDGFTTNGFGSATGSTTDGTASSSFRSLPLDGVALRGDDVVVLTDAGALYRIAGAAPGNDITPPTGAITPIERQSRSLLDDCGGCVAQPIDTATGAFLHRFDDLEIPGRGVPLRLERTYNSLNAGVEGSFGRGWAFTYGMSLRMSSTGAVSVIEENGSMVTFIPDGIGGLKPAAPRVLSTLARSGSGYTFTRRQTEIFEFDASGRLSAIRDLNGLRTTISYTVFYGFKLMLVEEPGGRRLVFRFDANHPERIVAVGDPIGRYVNFSYDPTWRFLTDVYAPDGARTQFGYDPASGRMTSMTDPAGRSVTTHYDGEGRVDRQTDRNNKATTLAYGVSDPRCPMPGSVGTRVTLPGAGDPAGNIMIDSYLDGRLVCQTKAAGTPEVATFRFGYDPATNARTSVTDPFGATTNYTFDSRGNRTSVEDALRRRQSWTYNQYNQVTSYRDGNYGPSYPNTTTYTYGDPTTSPPTPGWLLTRVERPLIEPGSQQPSGTEVTRYRYDTRYRSGTSGSQYLDLIEYDDPLRKVTQVRYDPATGAPIATVDPLGYKTTFGWDGIGRRTTAVSPKGNVPGADANAFRTAVVYDREGRPTVSVDELAKGVVDGFGRPDSSPLGVADSGTPWVAAPGGASWAVAGGAASLATAAGDQNLAYQTGAADGTIAFATPEPQDWLGVVFRGDGTVSNYWTVWQSKAYGVWVLSKMQAGVLTNVAYSPANTCCSGRQVVTVAFVGSEIKVSLDGHAVLSVSDAAMSTNTKVGLRASQPGPGRVAPFVFARNGGNLTAKGYDANGNVSWIRNGNGHTTGYRYDGENRRTQVIRADSTSAQPNIVTTDYHDNGAVKRHVDATGAATAFAYDHLSRPTSTTDPANRVIRVGYGTTVNQSWVTDADGDRTTKTFDAAGQLASITHSDGRTPNVSFAYDNVGRRTRMIDGTGTTCYEYDSLHRLRRSVARASSACFGDAVSYGYNLRGEMTTIGYPGQGDVTRRFDDAGRLTSVTDFLGTGSNTTYFGYDPNANVVCQTQTATACDLGGASPAFRMGTNYDAANRVSWMLGVHGANFANAWTYRRDAVGQVKAVDSAIVGANETYSYTPLDQINGVNSGSYRYDNADNLTGLTNGGSLTYDAANQPRTLSGATGATQATYTYDFAGDAASAPSHTGNRIQVDRAGGASTRYTYDQNDRLSSVGSPASPGNLSAYGYDGDGLRQFKSVWTLPTNFTWNRVDSSLLRAGRPGAFTYYIYGPGGRPIEQIRDNGTTKTATFLWQDQQGSTRLVTNAAGSTIGTYSYDPYGNTTSHTDSTSDLSGSTDLQYTGQYRDGETGFYYMRARYYDPSTGQFITRDPMVRFTRSPYGYVAHNPLTYDDPSGACIWDACVVEGVVIGALVVGLVVTAWYTTTPQYQNAASDIGQRYTDWWNSHAMADDADWKWPVQDPNVGNCEEIARDIQAHTGGDLIHITPPPVARDPRLGPSKNDPTGKWREHWGVERDGRIYDGFTGEEGLSVEEYKEQWEYEEDLNFEPDD